MGHVHKAMDHRTVKNIWNAYHYEECLGFIVHGNRGAGKSTYCVLIGSQCIGRVDEPCYDNRLKKWMVWPPKDFVGLVLKTNWNQIWMDWEDFGYWCNRLFWYDEFVKEALRYMTIQRTQFTAIMAQTPTLSLISNKILEMEDVFRVKIIKRDSTSNQPSRPRCAELYLPWHSPYNSRAGCNLEYVEYFRGLMPDDFYTWYSPLRKSFRVKAAENMRVAMARSKSEAMKNQLESVIEEMVQGDIMPPPEQVKELAEVVDQHASYKEQEVINKQRRHEREHRKPLKEKDLSAILGNFERDSSTIELRT